MTTSLASFEDDNAIRNPLPPDNHDNITTSMATTPNIGLSTGGLFESLSPTDLVSIITYWSIGSVGIVGNGLVCVVFRIIKTRRSQVNLFIINQAFADLATSVLLVIFGTTRLFRSIIPINGGFRGEFLCRFWWSRFFLFSCFAVSTFNLTAMSVERYIAVVHPLRYQTLFNSRNVTVIMGTIWFIAPVMQYIFPIWMYAAANDACVFQATWTFAAGCTSGVILFCWEYFFPCLIMSTAYLTILVRLHKKDKSMKASQEQTQPSVGSGVGGADNTRRLRAHRRRRNITVTLFLLFIVYLLCWTPNQFTFLQFNIGGPLDFNGVWYHFTVVAAFLNTTINPFIYALKHSQFQTGLRVLFKRSKVSPTTDDTGTAVDPDATVID